MYFQITGEITTEARFAVCLKNEGCEDLELRKLYRVLEDAEAAREGYLRIVDESGEDYLYPADCFALLELPEQIERALLAA